MDFLKFFCAAVLIYIFIDLLDLKGYRRDGKRWYKIIELEQYCNKHGMQSVASKYRRLRKKARKNAQLARNLDACERAMEKSELENYSARAMQRSIDELNMRLSDIQMRM